MKVYLQVPHHFDAPSEYPDLEFVESQQDPEAWVPDPHKSIKKAHLLHMPMLRVISTPSTGTNHIPMELCQAYGIEVLSLLDNRAELYNIHASSEFAFMLMLMTLKKVHVGLVSVQARRWRENEDLIRGNELYQKWLGIVGYGRIGRNVAQWADEMEARIVIHDPDKGVAGYWPRHVPLDKLFQECDIVLISCSLTSETIGMIGEDLLLLMKKNACLVNISRGEVLDEEGVARALDQRPDIRIGVDVLANESIGQHLSSPLLNYPRQVLVTPHMAGTTYESQEKAARIALDLVRDYGRP